MEVILTTFVSNKYVFYEHEVCQKLNNKYSESSTSQALQRGKLQREAQRNLNI